MEDKISTCYRNGDLWSGCNLVSFDSASAKQTDNKAV